MCKIEKFFISYMKNTKNLFFLGKSHFQDNKQSSLNSATYYVKKAEGFYIFSKK